MKRLEKELKNISSDLKNVIDSESKSFPYLTDINRLYAFETSFTSVTAGYLLHCLRKEYIKGGPHQIVVICEIENKTDELSLLLEATLNRMLALNNKELDKI